MGNRERGQVEMPFPCAKSIFSPHGLDAMGIWVPWVMPLYSLLDPLPAALVSELPEMKLFYPCMCMSWLLGYASFPSKLQIWGGSSWHPGLLSLLSWGVWWPRKDTYPGHHLWLLMVGPSLEGGASGSCGGLTMP